MPPTLLQTFHLSRTTRVSAATTPGRGQAVAVTLPRTITLALGSLEQLAHVATHRHTRIGIGIRRSAKPRRAKHVPTHRQLVRPRPHVRLGSIGHGPLRLARRLYPRYKLNAPR